MAATAMTATKNKKVLPQGVGVVVVGHPRRLPILENCKLPLFYKQLTKGAKEKPGRSASTSPAGGPMARERTIRDVFIIPWIDTAVTPFCVHVDMAHREGTIYTA